MTDPQKKLARLAELSYCVCEPYWVVLPEDHWEHGGGCAIASAEGSVILLKRRAMETGVDLWDRAQALCDLLNEASD